MHRLALGSLRPVRAAASCLVVFGLCGCGSGVVDPEPVPGRLEEVDIPQDTLIQAMLNNQVLRKGELEWPLEFETTAIRQIHKDDVDGTGWHDVDVTLQSKRAGQELTARVRFQFRRVYEGRMWAAEVKGLTVVSSSTSPAA